MADRERILSSGKSDIAARSDRAENAVDEGIPVVGYQHWSATDDLHMVQRIRSLH